MPGRLARRAHPGRHRHVERAPADGVVRRLGAAYIIRVGTAVCSANSLIRDVCSTTSWVIAVSRPSRRRRGGCAGWSACGSRRARTSAAASAPASPAGRARACAASAASTTWACGVPLEPNPPPTCGAITRICSGSRPKDRRQRLRAPSARPASSRTGSASPSRPDARPWCAAPSGCCAPSASCRSRSTVTSAAANAASTSPSSVSVGIAGLTCLGRVEIVALGAQLDVVRLLGVILDAHAGPRPARAISGVSAITAPMNWPRKATSSDLQDRTAPCRRRTRAAARSRG